jgi:hypothetical protein
MKNIAFYCMLSVLAIVIAVAGDLSVGQFNETAELRITARQFREEAAYLRLTTKNLVPGIDHLYYLDARETEGVGGQSPKVLRRFRTDRNGVVTGQIEAAPTAKKKIIFFGGSTTECNEVAEPFRFPAVVESRLLPPA